MIQWLFVHRATPTTTITIKNKTITNNNNNNNNNNALQHIHRKRYYRRLKVKYVLLSLFFFNIQLSFLYILAYLTDT